AVLRHIIRLASKGTKHSLDQRRNGTVGGIYVALVRSLHIICAIRVRIPCARIALKVQVDFDDKTSWEYLFKMYWVFLKEKLSLTLDELTKAKNPWKENAIMEKPFGDLGASFSKRRKMLKQQAFFNKVESVEAEKPGITKNHLRPTDIISKRSEAVATQMAVLGNSDGPPIIAIDTRCKTHEKVDEKGQKANPDEFAAIDVHNMNLIYLRRSLMENLIDDVEKFNDKVVGSFVRIRIPCDQKQDIYRLVQVVGTIKAAEPYKIGEKTIDVMIEILNLDKKEVVSINGISNQELSEDECQQLRQSIIKSGQIKWFTVGEILEKAMALQAVRVNDVSSLTSELQLINDCLLNSPDERHRRLHEIPDIHRDPNRNLFSDDASGELDEKKKVWRVSEKQENSILLTDTLVGHYSQLQQLVQHSHMPTEDASMAIEDRCWNKDEDARESKDQKVNQMESKQPEGSLNPMQNDTSGHCQILEVELDAGDMERMRDVYRYLYVLAIDL
ncbi:hypothetical protein Godav_020485, partial [Gossypium davidsonii]|nr:hypothetical protein [Gossypium davidsonii]